MDLSIRQLERDQSPEGQARWLRERVRLGSTLMIRCLRWHAPDFAVVECPDCGGTGKRSLPWDDRLCLASLCGHAGARILIGQRPLPLSFYSNMINGWNVVDNLPFEGWIEKLKDYPGEILEQAALAACGAWLVNLETKSDKHIGIFPGQALKAAERYLNDPTPVNQGICSRVGTTQGPCRLLAFYIGAYEYSQPGHFTHVISLCGNVREDIQKALLKWVLNE